MCDYYSYYNYEYVLGLVERECSVYSKEAAAGVTDLDHVEADLSEYDRCSCILYTVGSFCCIVL